MARPTLIVGVGGTGQWVLAHIKKNLMDAYGKIPDEVKLISLDTTTAPDALAGGRGDARDGQTPAGVIDITREHVYVGGDAFNFVTDVRAGHYPCVGSWLDADWFSRLPGSKALLNLTMGAGRFRPLGRLAVFYDLNQGTRSTLRSALRAAILQIRDASQARGFYAFITGSLAGGTGSGMFADVAHLIRAIAERETFPAKIRGYFVLPQAFEGTLGQILPQQRSDTIAKSYAAMREISRFAAEFAFAEGYPMIYDCDEQGGDTVTRGHVRSTLFELLYYLDGNRNRNSLQQVPIEHGVTPSIAEAIVAMIDDRTGGILEQHAVNVVADRNALNLTPDVVTAGSIGTYSWIFPIHDIIEGWTHQLAREVLQLWLQPEGNPDARSSVTNRLADDIAGNRAGQNGREAARSFWEKMDMGGVRLGQTPRDLGKIGQAWGVGPQALAQVKRTLQERTLEQWLSILAPQPGDDSQIDTSTRPKVDEVVNRFLHPQEKKISGGWFNAVKAQAVVPTTKTSKDKAEAKQPKLGAERIHQAVTDFFDVTHLGPLDTRVGGRTGGEFDTELSAYATWQIERFRQVLEAFAGNMLNGVAADDESHAVENRAGKLGHLRSLLKSLAADLDGAKQAIDEARSERQRAGARNELERRRTNAYNAMQNDTGKQEGYLEVCDQLLQLERWDIAARLERNAAIAMYEYVMRLLTGLDAWIEALATSAQGVFAGVVKGQARVDSDRRAVDVLSYVRHVVNDPDYEARRYTHYTQQRKDAVAAILHDLVWHVERDQLRDTATRELKPYLKVRLSLQGAAQDGHGAAELAKTPVQSNLDALLRRCRQELDDAREAESISAYLIDKYDGATPQRAPEELANVISSHNAPLLRTNGNSIPYNYLRYHQDPTLPNQQQFIQRVLNQLAANSHVLRQQAAQEIPSNDRFRLTFLYHQEVTRVTDVEAYQEGQREYRNLDAGRRRVHHIFPAERNAVLYEASLNRILPHRVVLQLEDAELFNLAVLIWLYGQRQEPVRLLHRYSYHDRITNQLHEVWRLTLPPETGEYDRTGALKQTEHLFLTDPAREPRLLDALETFTVGKRVRWIQTGDSEPEDRGDPTAGQGQGHAIPYELVSQKVERFKKEDLQDRLNRKVLGTRAVMFQGALGLAQSQQNLTAVQSLVAQFEKAQEGKDQLRTARATLDENSPEYSFYLVIEEHLDHYAGKLHQEINRYVGASV